MYIIITEIPVNANYGFQLFFRLNWKIAIVYVHTRFFNYLNSVSQNTVNNLHVVVSGI